MFGYIKDIKTFQTIDHFTVESYTLYPETSSGKSGSAVVTAELPDYTGNWLCLDGSLWIIGQSTPNNEKTTLKLLHPIFVFDRASIYTASDAASTVGGFIASKIYSEYISQSDTEYRLAYMSVTNADTTAFVAPVTENGDIFNLADYINTARRTGTDIAFTFTSTNVYVAISTKVASSMSVFFDDGHSKLVSVTFSREACAKLTIRKATETEGQYTTTVYYLSASGTISTTAPALRATGAWQFISCGKDDDLDTVAREHFAENAYTHKIEFYSDRRFGLYDKVSLSLPTGIFNTQINEIQKSSADNRYRYTCGDLPTTLTEQISAKDKEKNK